MRHPTRVQRAGRLDGGKSVGADKRAKPHATLQDRMTTLRIYDLDKGVLVIDLSQLIDLFAPRSLQSQWTVTPVTQSDGAGALFDATGRGGEILALHAKTREALTGATLAALARDTQQIIWGEFKAADPGTDAAWVTIRFIDSTFCEIETSDQTVLDAVRSSYKDVRSAAVG